MEKTPRELLVEDYKKALNTHDWYYHYSDSQEAWRAGADNESRLLKIAENDSELMQLWQEKWKQMFKDKD